jgi:hypothetical protein
MAITQDQFEVLRQQVSDLRVHVETLTGRLDLTNERLSSTNDVLKTLVDSLNRQSEKSDANRKWVVGTCIGVIVIAINLFLRFI